MARCGLGVYRYIQLERNDIFHCTAVLPMVTAIDSAGQEVLYAYLL